jgi:hypothetical protein
MIGTVRASIFQALELFHRWYIAQGWHPVVKSRMVARGMAFTAGASLYLALRQNSFALFPT